jgi:hypothetical protein
MTDPTRHALAKIARMAAVAPAGLPFLDAIERTARAALADPAGELDADVAAASGLLSALSDYATDVDAAAVVLDAVGGIMPTTHTAHARAIASSLRDLAAALRP